MNIFKRKKKKEKPCKICGGSGFIPEFQIGKTVMGIRCSCKREK